jgi:hypothetical protein
MPAARSHDRAAFLLGMTKMKITKSTAARKKTVPVQYEENELLEATLYYRQIGWPVVALHHPHGGGCSCRQGRACSHVGKHPQYHRTRLKSGLKAATTDEGTVRDWWKRWPDANVGIVTGPSKSGTLVLDVDGELGRASLDELQEQQGQLPTTPMDVSGGGGMRLYFQYPYEHDIRDSIGKLAPGIDVRAAGRDGGGGIIVVAPSLHGSGNRYEWLSSPDKVPLAPVPPWLLERLLALQERPETGRAPAQKTLATMTPWDGGVIPSGTRNNTLFRHGCSLRAQGAECSEIEDELMVVNAQWCVPPLEPNEVSTCARSASKYPVGNLSNGLDPNGFNFEQAQKIALWIESNDTEGRLAAANEGLKGASQRIMSYLDVALLFCVRRKDTLSNNGYSSAGIGRCAATVASEKNPKFKGYAKNHITVASSMMESMGLTVMVGKPWHRLMKHGGKSRCAKYVLGPAYEQVESVFTSVGSFEPSSASSCLRSSRASCESVVTLPSSVGFSGSSMFPPAVHAHTYRCDLGTRIGTEGSSPERVGDLAVAESTTKRFLDRVVLAENTSGLKRASMEISLRFCQKVKHTEEPENRGVRHLIDQG